MVKSLWVRGAAGVGKIKRVADGYDVVIRIPFIYESSAIDFLSSIYNLEEKAKQSEEEQE